MDKLFVLDTNVILFDPMAIFRFGKNDVLIPLIVVEEVDRFKRDQNENGRNARHFSRLVDDLRKNGSLTEGVQLDNGGRLKISIDRAPKKVSDIFDLSIADNKILATALAFKEEREKVLLVSKDINLRLKADILDIEAEDYGKKDVSIEELYSGKRIYEVESERLNEFDKNRLTELSEQERSELCPNEYLLLQEKGN